MFGRKRVISATPSRGWRLAEVSGERVGSIGNHAGAGREAKMSKKGFIPAAALPYMIDTVHALGANADEAFRIGVRNYAQRARLHARGAAKPNSQRTGRESSLCGEALESETLITRALARAAGSSAPTRGRTGATLSDVSIAAWPRDQSGVRVQDMVKLCCMIYSRAVSYAKMRLGLPYGKYITDGKSAGERHHSRLPGHLYS